MVFAPVSQNSYFIRLEKGEEIIDSLKQFCQKKKIKNASLTAIGSLKNPTLAHYRVDTKKYKEKTIEGIFEITSMIGTIAIADNQPLVHAHITLSDEEMVAYGGHLIRSVVSATVEVILTAYKSSYVKLFNKEIGLKLFDLPEKQ